MVQWLGLGAFTTAVGRVQSLVGELRSRKTRRAAKKKKKYPFYLKILLSSGPALHLKEMVCRVACGEDAPGIPQILSGVCAPPVLEACLYPVPYPLTRVHPTV